MSKTRRPVMLLAIAALTCGGVQSLALPAARQDATLTQARDNSSALARQLMSPDAAERLRAAEELAALEAREQRRLVEGYRLQEKNARVKVALDWALYRMGRRESLFDLVRALDSSRSDQAQVYLSQLDTPEPLYAFLERANGHTQIKLLQVLSHVGDAATLERIAPLARSLDPKVAEAARTAGTDINERLASPPPDPKKLRRAAEPARDEEEPAGEPTP